MSKYLDLIAATVLASFALFIIFSVVVWLPMMVRAEARCLALGYPESRVTWNLHTYCVSLEGTTQTAVKELP